MRGDDVTVTVTDVDVHFFEPSMREWYRRVLGNEVEDFQDMQVLGRCTSGGLGCELDEKSIDWRCCGD